MLWLEKKIMIRYKGAFLILKMSFKFPLKKNEVYGRKKEKSFSLHGDGLKQLLTIIPMEKHLKKTNKTSENMTYLINNKTFLCQYNRLHPLTARR